MDIKEPEEDNVYVPPKKIELYVNLTEAGKEYVCKTYEKYIVGNKLIIGKYIIGGEDLIDESHEISVMIDDKRILIDTIIETELGTSVVETPVVETPVVETPVVETPVDKVNSVALDDSIDDSKLKNEPIDITLIDEDLIDHESDQDITMADFEDIDNDERTMEEKVVLEDSDDPADLKEAINNVSSRIGVKSNKAIEIVSQMSDFDPTNVNIHDMSELTQHLTKNFDTFGTVLDGRDTIRLPLHYSGYNAHFKGFSFTDFLKWQGQSSGPFLTRVKNEIRLIHNHITRTSRPGLVGDEGFEEFCNKTYFDDYRQLYFGVFSATDVGQNIFPLTCPHCRKLPEAADDSSIYRFEHVQKNSKMAFITDMKHLISKKLAEDGILNETFVAGRSKNSSRCTGYEWAKKSTRVKVGDENLIFEFQKPTIAEVFNMLPYLLELEIDEELIENVLFGDPNYYIFESESMVDTLNATLCYILLYVKVVGVPIIKETGTGEKSVTYGGVVDKERIFEIVMGLDTSNYSLLIADKTVLDIITTRPTLYALTNIKHICKKHLRDIIVNIRDQFFINGWTKINKNVESITKIRRTINSN